MSHAVFIVASAIHSLLLADLCHLAAKCQKRKFTEIRLNRRFSLKADICQQKMNQASREFRELIAFSKRFKQLCIY